jgi:pre-mRNA-splicing factor 38A
MANQTDPLAASVHGTNPQNLIEKILRGRIYENRYWKEHCFGLSAETLLDKAVKLDGIGGIYSHNAKPTPFICLVLKLLQIQPERDIIEEYLKQEDFKYLRALAAFYIRLTFRARDVYQLLEPLFSDYRKLCVRSLSSAAGAGGWKLTHMDEFLDELLTAEMSCDVILPHLPKRETLVNSGMLEGPRISPLDDELNDDDDDEKEEEEEERECDEKIEQDFSRPEKQEQTSHNGNSKSSSSSNSLANMLKRAQVRHRNDNGGDANDVEERETQRRRIDDEHESSQSLEEANALRAKLGLKPLRP